MTQFYKKKSIESTKAAFYNALLHRYMTCGSQMHTADADATQLSS